MKKMINVPLTATELCREAMKTLLFTGDGARPAALKGTYTAGSSNVVIVTGSNGSGKSLLRRIFYTLLKNHNAGVSIRMSSQEGRSGYMASMIYGLEEMFPTGLLSINTTKRILLPNNESEKLAVIIDEPEIGMAEETSMAFGQMLFEEIQKQWECLTMVVVITHNRHIARSLSKLNPNYIQLGSLTYLDLNAWINREVVPADIDKLQSEAAKRKERALAILNTDGRNLPPVGRGKARRDSSVFP